jgi:2-polyprenyl-6-methoxyphenol hydroxylase-like FAD-dependent oxidoreductase
VQLDPLRQGRINELQVWDCDSDSKFNLAEQGMSVTVENSTLVSALHRKALERGVEVRAGQKVLGARDQGSTVQVVLEGGETLEGSLLVLSGGRGANLKDKLGMYSYGRDHNQRAIVCALQTSAPSSIGYQKFSQEGVLGVLPLWDQFASIVWSLDLP